MSTAKPRVAVLVSGEGTNLQALIDAVAARKVAAELALVVSNRAAARGLERARIAGIPAEYDNLPLTEAPHARPCIPPCHHPRSGSAG